MSEQLPSDTLSRLKRYAEQNSREPWIPVKAPELLVLVECAETLRRFAAMDRPDCDLAELACSRGVASDMTILVSRDFRRAAEVLTKLEAL